MTDIGGTVPPPPRPVGYETADRRLWWATLLGGLLLVGLGGWMLTNLVESVTVLAILVGLSLIVGGFLEVAAAGGHAAGHRPARRGPGGRHRGRRDRRRVAAPPPPGLTSGR